MEAIFNKKSKFNFKIEDIYESGIILEGWERKPILKRQINLDASYVIIKNSEIFLLNAVITPEGTALSVGDCVKDRMRKLLLNKKEISKLIINVEQKGYTIVPIKVYTKGKYIKVQIALAKGKNDRDKRETLLNRDVEKENARILKRKKLN